jgi:CheY-like chemotaxis protein
LRKGERLDQILVRLGHITPDQVTLAFDRQQAQGGRIGQNLIEVGALTEEQLFDGLVEQFQIPTITVDESTLDRTLLDRMPSEVLDDGLIIPVAWNEALGVLSVASANPSDEDAIERVRVAFGAKKVRVSLAPESILADLVLRLGLESGDHASGGDSVRLVALPELFEPDSDDDPGGAQDSEAESRRLVMVTSSASRRNFLPPVLRAEGYELVVVGTLDDFRAAMVEVPEALIVDVDMSVTVEEWMASDGVPPVSCEVAAFSSIGEVLIDNPAPYAATVASVRAAAQAIAEYRAIAEGISPPYSLMAADLDLLADGVGLGRLARDGMHIGLHLLVPVTAGTSIDPFRDFAATIELAHRLRFPWPVDTMLSNVLGLYIGRVDLEALGDTREEVILAAQVLSLVWFRHNIAGETAQPSTEATDAGVAEGSGEEASALRSSLRALAGRFATLEVIESYVELIAERESGDADVIGRSVMLVGGERVSRVLAPALGRGGCEVVLIADGAEAQSRIEEVRPHAVIIDHQAFGSALEKICRVLRMDRSTLVFVLTDESDPALVLNLLDVGVDDVFGPPHDFDLIAARVQRSIRSHATTPVADMPPGNFAARFDAFSFLDLAQVLANGHKNVCVELRRGTGEEAVLYVEKGRPVHAACGALTGPQAVYYVVAWEDDGEFTVNDTTDFPDPNISESIESLLMEGVRLLDESRA